MEEILLPLAVTGSFTHSLAGTLQRAVANKFQAIYLLLQLNFWKLYAIKIMSHRELEFNFRGNPWPYTVKDTTVWALSASLPYIRIHTCVHIIFTKVTESQNGRGWQGPLWLTQSNPLPKQGHPQQAAQHRVQAGLEYLQRRRLHSLPGQPGPGLHHPQREEVLPQVQLELPLLQFVPVAPCPVAGHRWTESGPVLLTPTLQIFVSVC